MKYPSGYCAKGQHLVTFEVRPGVRQCTWCGERERTSEPLAPATVGVQPSLSVTQTGKQGTTAQPTVVGVVAEIESRFRAYAASAQHLQNWIAASNKLPKVYL